MKSVSTRQSCRRRCRRTFSAFTLVELLVVIGIIALLISILLPALSKARRAAEEVKCMSNIRQLCLGVMIYCEQYKGSMPFKGDDGTTSIPVDHVQFTNSAANDKFVGWNSPGLWFNGLCEGINQPTYYDQQTNLMRNGVPLGGAGSKSIFSCPSASEPVTTLNPEESAGGIKLQGGYVYLHGKPSELVPIGDETRPTYFCYVLNSHLTSSENHHQAKISQFSPSSAVVLMVEKRIQPGEIPVTDIYYPEGTARPKADHKRFSGRHRGGGMLGFVDGHVAWFSNAEVNVLQNAVGQAIDYNQPSRVIWNPFAASED